MPEIDPRLERRSPEDRGRSAGPVPVLDQPVPAPTTSRHSIIDRDHPLRGASDGVFRDDLERIRFSPYFSRLAAVTQVISQGAAGQVVHNRLTHTIKVTAVARAIAIGVNIGPGAPLIEKLGGCDPVVVQAAASAHDLGHPPFGHLGERMLDRVARARFGLIDGFEGNAQTFRILTELGVHGTRGEGLNLTAAVRAAVLKYPWSRVGVPDPHPHDATIKPRGAGAGPDAPGSLKYSSYLLDATEMQQVRAAYPEIDQWQQTPECAVMDVADDIAYSLHDLDDFHRAGILQHASVAAEFRSWMGHRAKLNNFDTETLLSAERRPGNSLELLRRRLKAKDAWTFDDDAFAIAVDRVGIDLIDGLLAVPFDGSINAERAIGVFTSSWIAHLQDSVAVVPDPHIRSGYIALGSQAWHEVAVLKFVHQRFVLDRPDLAMYQRGQGQILTTLVGAFDSWLSDGDDAHRAPRRLVDLVDLATESYRRLRRETPHLLRGPNEEDFTSEDDLIRLGRGRGIIDYVASLTDDRAVATAASVSGATSHLWDAGSGL